MTESKLAMLLLLADTGPLDQQPDFGAVREKIAGFLGVPNDAALADETVKKSYRVIRNGVALLRQGQPWTILGHRFQLTKEIGLTFDMPSMEANLQEVIIQTLTEGKDLLRCCKRRGCRNLFVKRSRQKYCTKQCSGLARIRRFRRKQTFKRFSTGSPVEFAAGGSGEGKL